MHSDDLLEREKIGGYHSSSSNNTKFVWVPDTALGSLYAFVLCHLTTDTNTDIEAETKAQDGESSCWEPQS